MNTCVARWTLVADSTSWSRPRVGSIACIPLDPRRIVISGYGERRVRGTPSLLGPGQPLEEDGAFVRSVRFSPLR